MTVQRTCRRLSVPINRDAAQAGIKAVLLFTDGRHNDPAAQDPRAVAKTLSEIPVYVVPVGSSHTPRDLILHHVDAPRAVVDGDQLVVEATVTACDCAGEKCTVELSEHNAVVDRQELSINSPRRDFRVRLTTTAKGGGPPRLFTESESRQRRVGRGEQYGRLRRRCDRCQPPHSRGRRRPALGTSLSRPALRAGQAHQVRPGSLSTDDQRSRRKRLAGTIAARRRRMGEISSGHSGRLDPRRNSIQRVRRRSKSILSTVAAR